jgi:Mrp family chromosome partitioning ATPase
MDALKQEISILKRKEKRIASQMKDKESEDLSGKELRYAILEWEVATNKELYEALLTSFKEMEVLKGIGQEEVRLVEKAQLPLTPIKPKPFLNMLLGLFTGLALGVGLSFFLEYMDRSIKDKKHVERHLKLPVLSLVPKGEEVIIRREITGEMVESFQNLSTNLKFQAMNKPMKVLLITSPGVEEGKTTVVRNLGITLARSNDKVLMIDADLKFPSLSKTLSHNGNGLTELLKEFPSFKNNGWFNEEFSFGDVQRLIFAEGKSGIMTILKEEKQFQALFDQGRLVDLCWQNRPPERRLGQILLRNKAIEEETLKDALELARSAKRRMGSVLLSLYSVPPERVEKLLDLHLSETISLLYSDRNGRYEFTERKVERDGLIFGSLLEKFHLQGNSPWLEKWIKNYLVNTEVENLMFLPSGSPIQNPLPLIASRRFEVILSVLKDKFDYILLDSPPIFLADAVTLSQYSDGNLLVLMAGRTRPENAKKALDILNGAGSYIAGVILNGIDMKKNIDYYYGKYYGNERR